MTQELSEIKSSNKPLFVTSWYDNKRFTLISNFVGKNNVDQCTCFDRKQGTNIKVQRPAALRIYSSFMGEVDKAQQAIVSLPHKVLIKKMVPSYFFHLVNQCAVNAWIIHHEIGGNDSYLKFLSSTAISLCNSTSDVVSEEFLLPLTKKVKASYIPESVRFDRYDHQFHLM